MIALLKLIPFKDWVYGGIIAALLVGFGVYTAHERHIGAENQAVKTARVAEKAEAQVQEVTVTAQKEELKSAKDFDQAVAAGPVSGIGIVCQRTGARRDQVPQAGSVTASRAGEQSTDGTEGRSYDPSGAVLTRTRDADAQIAYLQGRVHELEKQMEDSP